MRRLAVISSAVAVGGAVLWWFLRNGHESEVRYETAKVERGDLIESVTATGTLQARVTVQLGSQVSGTISAVAVDFNTPVKRGQTLAAIDPAIFEAEAAQTRATLDLAQADVAQARAASEQARLNHDRAQELYKGGFETVQGLDKLKLALDTAQAELTAALARVAQARATLDRARVNLEHTVIRSPIDGVVISRSVDVGQTVAASLQVATLFTLAADLRQMEVQVNVDEADVGKLHPGQNGQFQVDAFPGEVFRGTLRQIRNASITVQNVVTYVAVFDVENADLTLRPGMTTNVTIETARKQNVVKVSNAALRFRPTEANGAGKTRARIAAGQGKVHQLVGGKPQATMVRTGPTDGEYTELLEGVAAGQEVIVGTLDPSSNGKKPRAHTPGFRRPF